MRSSGKDASSGDLSLLLLIVKVVAQVLFSQDVAPPFNKPRLIGKLSLQQYGQLHVVSLDCIMGATYSRICMYYNFETNKSGISCF